MIPWKTVMRTIRRVDAAHADGGLASTNRVSAMIAEVPPGGGLSQAEIETMIAAAVPSDLEIAAIAVASVPSGLDEQAVGALIDAALNSEQRYDVLDGGTAGSNYGGQELFDGGGA